MSDKFWNIILFAPPASVPIHKNPLSGNRQLIKSLESDVLLPVLAEMRLKLAYKHHKNSSPVMYQPLKYHHQKSQGGNHILREAVKIVFMMNITFQVIAVNHKFVQTIMVPIHSVLSFFNIVEMNVFSPKSSNSFSGFKVKEPFFLEPDLVNYSSVSNIYMIVNFVDSGKCMGFFPRFSFQS